MKKLLPLLLSLFTVCAHAQEVTVRGMASCSQWTQARARQDATQMQIWILGYLSGVAMSLNKNALKDTPPKDLYREVDNYCKANPQMNLDMAATTLFASLAKPTDPAAAYEARALAAIRPNITYPDVDRVAGNSAAEFDVNLAPDGTIVGVKLRKSSGVPGWDEAAERAIRRTSTLPRDVDGRVRTPLTLRLAPKD